MQMLYLLQENTEIRTLLQYGIVEEDYDMGTVNGETVIYTKNSGYHMDLLYTGNCYRTYPASGVPMSYWDEVKELNLDTEIFPFMNYQIKVANGSFSEEDMKLYAEYLAILSVTNPALKEAYDNMDYETYKMSSKGVAAINRSLDAAKTAYDAAKAAYDAAKAAYDAATSDADKETALQAMNESMAEMEVQNATVESCNKALIIKNSDLDTAYNFAALCQKFYNASK